RYACGVETAPSVAWPPAGSGAASSGERAATAPAGDGESSVNTWSGAVALTVAARVRPSGSVASARIGRSSGTLQTQNRPASSVTASPSIDARFTVLIRPDERETPCRFQANDTGTRGTGSPDRGSRTRTTSTPVSCSMSPGTGSASGSGAGQVVARMRSRGGTASSIGSTLSVVTTTSTGGSAASGSESSRGCQNSTP